MAERQRIEWVDCAKGITILLVIIGHTVSKLYGVIYSFHMPLFFALSCFTYRYSKNTVELKTSAKSAFRHLVLPGIFIYLVTITLFIRKNFSLFSSVEYLKSFFVGKVLTLIYASAWEIKGNAFYVEAIGPIWFLTALFVGRTLFDHLHLKLPGKKLIAVSFLLSGGGVLLSKIMWLPLSMDVVFALMPIFYFGSIMTGFHVERKPFTKLALFGIMWALAFAPFFVIKTYLDFGMRSYPLYPFCLLTTVFGTLMISELSVLLVRFKKVMRSIIYLGKNSLYMLLIHYIDGWYADFWIVEESEYATAFYRILIDILLFAVVMFFVEKIKRGEASG